MKKRVNFVVAGLLICGMISGIVCPMSADVSEAGAKSIKVKKKISINIGEYDILKAKVKPVKLENKVKFSSTNKKVAKVDAWGKITGVKAGSAKIIAKVKGTKLKAACKVTVIDPLKQTYYNWQEAYLYIIGYYINGHDRYALINIDGDNIPELYMGGMDEATGDGIYSFKNGKLLELRLGRTNGGRYIENSGLVYNSNGNMGYYYTEIYKLQADNFSPIFYGTKEERGDYNTSYVYSIGDTSVSKADYYNAVDAVFDFGRATFLNQNEVGYDSIRRQIENYE